MSVSTDRLHLNHKQYSYTPLFWIIFVCMAPSIAAFMVFYAMKWNGKSPISTTNYGDLIPNPMPLPMFVSAQQEVNPGIQIPFSNGVLSKKWVYLTVGSGNCDELCAKRLFTTRQLRAMAGRERDRIKRVWLVTDNLPIDRRLFDAHPDLIIVRINPNRTQVYHTIETPFLNAASGSIAAQHIWVLDPFTRLMMRFPVNYQPERMKKDVSRLLYASQSWQH